MNINSLTAIHVWPRFIAVGLEAEAEAVAEAQTETEAEAETGYR